MEKFLICAYNFAIFEQLLVSPLEREEKRRRFSTYLSLIILSLACLGYLSQLIFLKISEGGQNIPKVTHKSLL